MQPANQLFELLGPISPLASRDGPANSVSFAGDAQQENAGGGFTAQSRPARAPFGERVNTFEFGRPSLKGAADFKPFSALAARPPLPCADAAATPASAAETATGGATPMSTSAADDAVSPSSSVGPGSVTPLAGAAAALLPAMTPLPSTPLPAAAAAPRRSSVADTLLWRDPVSTVIAFALGAGAYFGARAALAGSAGVTPTSAVAYALLAHLGFNFLRFFCSARWHAAAMWEGSAWTDAAAERAVRVVRRAAALHDAFLSARDPHVTLAVVLALWTVAWLGTAFTAHQLAVGSYLAAFTLPPLYAANKAAVDGSLSAAYAATLGRIDAAEMPRTTRLGALLAALVALALSSSWAQTAIGALVAATYWRTTLRPADVAAIRTAAEPLTADVAQSVRKVRARLSAALDDARALVGTTGGPRTRTAPRTGKHRAT
ncbi:hypothetical protein Rsub_09395 [Raphidocelis subcapitata]|uniref:Reticulon-like protein n=1 Tax=Raphidocelis subcapitata TaxID=307507 RepID=A0A2V0PGX6_9CHLO|nr:hypothetical protein Rsub_09395 [Raphidocelis subcapitata]|eukprot:GBF96325.1 hypothetical protein Rsub_09395 [Raphidocelis subcapitata]